MSDQRIHLRIKQARLSMPDQQRRVADFVLDRPHECVGLSINELATAAGVSNTTVLRFCRGLGLSGYRDFRLSLARDWDSPESLVYVKIDDDEPLTNVVNRIFDINIQALHDTQRILDLEVLDQIVEAIVDSRRVDIYSAGGAGIAGRELHLKCMQMGINANAFLDSQMQVMSAASLTADDVGIGISHSGLQKHVSDALELAAEGGATTVAMTSYRGTPVAEAADLVLYTAALATDPSYGSPSIRNAQLALVDVIYEVMLLKRRDSAHEKMARVAKAIAAHDRVKPHVFKRHRRGKNAKIPGTQGDGRPSLDGDTARSAGKSSSSSDRAGDPGTL